MIAESHVEEVKEQVNSVKRRGKSDEEGLKLLKTHCQEMLDSMDSYKGMLIDVPAYGVMAFLGKIKFVDREFLDDFIVSDFNTEDYEILKDSGAIQIADSIRPLWDELVESNISAVCLVISLSYVLFKEEGDVLRIKETENHGG